MGNDSDTGCLVAALVFIVSVVAIATAISAISGASFLTGLVWAVGIATWLLIMILAY